MNKRAELRLFVSHIREERKQLEELIAQRCLSFSQATGMRVTAMEVTARVDGEVVQYDVRVLAALPDSA